MEINEKKNAIDSHKFCVAPMMDWSDRHCRSFHRVLTVRTRLYTEMVTATAILRGDRNKLLGFDPAEHPLALQIGGSDPQELAQAAQIAEAAGFDEVNLNVGCPSDRVQSGRFGACLMREPELVARCVAAMREAIEIPVTIKCRIGVDEQVPELSLFRLVDLCLAEGVDTFAVHARKAWLSGLSPKENRQTPPLDYGLVRRLKQMRPNLTLILNGGIATMAQALEHLDWADGVMLGRAAYHTPALLGEVDARVFGRSGLVDPFDAVERYRPYLIEQLARGVPLAAMTRHMLGLFSGRRGARAWRRTMTLDAVQPGAGLKLLDRAVAGVREAGAAAPVRAFDAAAYTPALSA